MGVLPAVIDLMFEPTFRLGDLVVRWSALVIAAAVLVALLTAAQLTRREKAGGGGLAPLRLDDLLYVTLSILPGAIVGGRIVYALGYLDHYAVQPMQLFDVTRGGSSMLGAVVGGTLSGVYIASLLEGSARRWAQTAAVPMMLAIGIGKLGQFVGGGGQGVFWDGPWAVAFDGPGPWQSVAAGSPAHPVALYEAIWAFVGVPVVWWGNRRLRSAGVGMGAAFVVALCWFLAGRVVLGAFFRDDRLVGPLNVEQALAALALAVTVAVVSLTVVRRTRRRAHAAPAAVDAAATPPGAVPATADAAATPPGAVPGTVDAAATPRGAVPAPRSPAVDAAASSPASQQAPAPGPVAVDGPASSPGADRPS